MNLISLFSSILFGAVTTLFCVHLLKPFAVHVGLVDIPGGRKTHHNPIPLIGGVSVFIGFCFALLSLDISLVDYRGLLAGAAILVLIGIIDDFHELTPRTRLMGQCLAGVLFVEWGHVFFHHLGNLFFLGDVGLGAFSVLITLFFVLGFVNAINMIDGVDGLAGSVVFTQAAFLVMLSFQFQQMQNAYFLLVFMGALVVFLGFNMPFPKKTRARIFLGDAGSTFLGFVIAYFAVQLSQVLLQTRLVMVGYNFMTVLWVLAYPFFDLLSVVIQRLAAGKSPFTAGHDHLHFVLLNLNIRPAFVMLILLSMSVSFGLVGIVLAKTGLSESWQLLLFLLVFLHYFLSTVFFNRRE